MLVVGLKTGERIRIGQDVWVKLVRTRDGAVRVGIDAPPEVKILREKLIDQSERAAA